MKNNYNKLIVIALAIMTMSFAAKAQEKGDKAVGANLVFTAPPGEFDLLGAEAKFRYNIVKFFRLESTFSYLFERDYVGRWDLFVNAHVLIPLGDRIRLYPLSGFGILGYNGEKSSATHLGCNLGGGVDYKISDKLILNIEYSYKWEAKWNDAWGDSYLSAGVLYCF